VFSARTKTENSAQKILLFDFTSRPVNHERLGVHWIFHFVLSPVFLHVTNARRSIILKGNRNKSEVY